MDVSSSSLLGLLRIIFKPLADFMERVLFYKAYEISTLYKIHREAFCFRPRKLTEGLEYQVFWMPYRLGQKLNTPMIWVRANDGCFEKLSLVVTASNDKIKYQDCVELYGVDDIPSQAALPSIPFRNLRFSGVLVMTPYDTVKVRVRELISSTGEKVFLDEDKCDMFMPFYRLEVAMGLERGDLEKWGEYFNLEFLEMEIKEERVRLLGESLYSSAPLAFLKRRISKTGWAVKMIFWSKNLVLAKHLTKRLELYLKEHEEFAAWKREKEKEENSHSDLV